MGLVLQTGLTNASKIQNEAAHLVTGLTRSVSLERNVQSIRGWTTLLQRGQKYKSK